MKITIQELNDGSAPKEILALTEEFPTFSPKYTRELFEISIVGDSVMVFVGLKKGAVPPSPIRTDEDIPF
jgi:hypothetical protein